MLYRIVEILYIGCSAWLALYGLNMLYLTLRYWGSNDQPKSTSPQRIWPRVTIQLPLYNEKHVVGRLLEAVSQIDYPRDLLEIQVLDDSTDDTVDLTQAMVDKLALTGLDIRYMHRPHREGFKAGALAYGLELAKGEYIGVFDADFVPPPHFLTATIPQFQDAQVGCVQTRWGYLNANVSAFARALSVALDGHYIVEKNAQYRSGYFINFNGSAGIWRKTAIESAGGWQADTLTEDMDLSMRAQLAGWRFEYLPDVVCPSELPFLIEGFRRQQFRWAKGATQAAGKLLGRLWLAQLPLMVKFQASMQLTAYLIPPLMLIAAGLTAFLSLSNSALPRWLPVLSLAALGLPALLLSAQVKNSRPWRQKLLDVGQLMLMGSGLTPTTGRAVFEAVLGIDSPFLRTPKFASEDEWTQSDYSLRIDPTVWVETFTMLAYFATIVATYSKAYWGTATILVLPVLGQIYLMWISVSQTRKIEKRCRELATEAHSESPTAEIEAACDLVITPERVVSAAALIGDDGKAPKKDIPIPAIEVAAVHKLPADLPLEQE
jgi:glycosyltransferase involved in cell wall biosynthesis